MTDEELNQIADKAMAAKRWQGTIEGRQFIDRCCFVRTHAPVILSGILASGNSSIEGEVCQKCAVDQSIKLANRLFDALEDEQKP